MGIVDRMWSALYSLAEARIRTPLVTGPVDLKGNLVKQPDPIGFADASVFSATSVPGQTIKDTSRNGRYADFRAMDTGDISALLDAVVSSALTFEDDSAFGFKLDGTKSNALNILNQMISFTELREKLPIIARDILKYGDGYLEIVEQAGFVARLQTYYPSQMYVTMTDKGLVTAYTQLNYAQQPVAIWTQGEIIHFKWERSDREPYSAKGLLDSFRDDWRDLIKLEQGMVIGRVSRAYPRNVHFIDITNKSTVDAQRTLMGYIQSVTRQLPFRNSEGFGTTVTRTDFAPNEDLFIPAKYIQGQDGALEKHLSDVKLLDPNVNGLTSVADIEYKRRKMFSTVPAEIVGIGQQYLDPAAQYRAYARLVTKLQKQLESGLRELFRQTLVIAGVSPDNVVIMWPTVVSGENYKFQEAQYRQALTRQVEIESGINTRQGVMREDGLTDEEIAARLAEYEEESKIFGKVPAPQSRAAQIGAGDASGNTPDTPIPTDTPTTQQNRNDQTPNMA